MTEDEIKDKTNAIFRDVFDDDTLEIRPDMTAEDVEAWDSLTHVNLIVAVEAAFKIRFTTKEVSNLGNVGDLLTLIKSKIG